MSTQPEETVGLDLFDETASAAGSFPNAMLGYERQAVDAYVRDIERQLSSAKRKVRSLQKQLSSKTTETDYSKLGAHTGELLRAAEAQAAEMIKTAQLEAERIVESATNDAAQVVNDANLGAEQARVGGLDYLGRMREDLAVQVGRELESSRAQADAVRAAADQHREMVLADAQREADAIVQRAELEAQHVLQQADRQAAETRAAIAREYEDGIGKLRGQHDEATRRMQEMVGAARANSEAFGAKLEADALMLDEHRQRSIEEANNLTAGANEQARATIAEARAKAAKLITEAERQAAEKAEQLRRETVRLNQRRQAIIGQLTSLSSLANMSVEEFPDDTSGATEGVAAAVDAALEDARTESDADPDPDDYETAVQPAVTDDPETAIEPAVDPDETLVQPTVRKARS